MAAAAEAAAAEGPSSAKATSDSRPEWGAPGCRQSTGSRDARRTFPSTADSLPFPCVFYTFGRVPRMKFLLLLVVVGAKTFGTGSCPSECECLVDELGRKGVLCGRGGLREHIPIGSMDRDVEVLRIWSPPNSVNVVTIGPIFQKFWRLEELDVVRSGVPAIGKHTFWGLSSLKVLNLTGNEISHLLDSNFRGLGNLARLHLDGNRIESMPSESFRHLHGLEVLTLARNKINELVPRIFLKLGKLQQLDLSENPLNELNPEVFKDVRGLQVFSCRLCRLVTLEPFFHRFLPELRELDLGDNRLDSLHSELFASHSHLEILRLDGNLLSNINEVTRGDAGLLHFSVLHLLDLSRNRLLNLAAPAFVGLTSLQTLRLNYNLLNRLDPALFVPVAATLRDLDLSGNPVPVEDLNRTVHLLSKLTSLSLSDMHLGDLPLGMFTRPNNLRFLNLSANHFSHISPHILRLLPRLYTLDLSKNAFRGFTEKVFVHLEKIPNLILRGNPWACDLCHVPPILKRADEPATRATFGEETCYEPGALRGARVLGLRGDRLPWCGPWPGPEVGPAGVLGGPPSTTGPPLAFLASVSSAAALVLAMGTAVVCALWARRRSDYYYTREESRGPGEITLIDPLKRKPNVVSIAVIDEITRDPELEMLTNGV